MILGLTRSGRAIGVAVERDDEVTDFDALLLHWRIRLHLGQPAAVDG
jgi:hypothetical protein